MEMGNRTIIFLAMGTGLLAHFQLRGAKPVSMQAQPKERGQLLSSAG